MEGIFSNFELISGSCPLLARISICSCISSDQEPVPVKSTELEAESSFLIRRKSSRLPPFTSSRLYSTFLVCSLIRPGSRSFSPRLNQSASRIPGIQTTSFSLVESKPATCYRQAGLWVEKVKSLESKLSMGFNFHHDPALGIDSDQSLIRRPFRTSNEDS